jgi:hypothetical protein
LDGENSSTRRSASVSEFNFKNIKFEDCERGNLKEVIFTNPRLKAMKSPNIDLIVVALSKKLKHFQWMMSPMANV